MAEKKTEVLIIGAGSIGRVYGYHLFKGGANVHYYVREHNKNNLTNYPLRMHQLTSSLRWFNKSHTEKFSNYSVTTDTEIASGNAPNLPKTIDYAIFTTPVHQSQGEWFNTLVKFLNNKYQKNIYYSSPAPDITGMQRFIDKGIDKAHLISGQIASDCYFAPLKNQRFEARGEENAKNDDEEDNPNQVVVYCQSGKECFGGLSIEANEATNRLVDILNHGGLNAENIGKDTEYGIRFPIMLPLFMSYTIYNWNFYELGKHFSIMTLVIGSFREISKIIKKKTNNKCSSSLKLMSYIPTLRISTICFAPFFFFLHFFTTRLSSLDIESIGNANYNGKLRDQTDFLINFVCEDAKKYNVEMTYFNKLIEKYRASQKEE